MKKFILIFISFLLCSGIAIIELTQATKMEKPDNNFSISNINDFLHKNTDKSLEVVEAEIIRKKTIVYDNMNMDQLVAKLNKSLNSNLAGKGDAFAKYSLQYGVDPYLAVAISLHETGCKWTCSYLVRACNNVGGQKGSPGCDGGSYKKFSSLDAGIEGFIKNIAKNYYAYGLTTPEAMQKKYAGSTSWASKVNNYISSIKKQ